MLERTFFHELAEALATGTQFNADRWDALGYHTEDDSAGCWLVTTGAPDVLLCAHLDRHPSAGVGYDDAVGVAITAAAVAPGAHVANVGVLYTVGEEDGGWGVRTAMQELDLSWAKACIVVDRCACWEIVDRIGNVQLCPPVMAQVIRRIAGDATQQYWAITAGLQSDASTLRKLAPTVNIATGVSQQHTAGDTFDAKAAMDALAAVIALLQRREEWLP